MDKALITYATHAFEPFTSLAIASTNSVLFILFSFQSLVVSGILLCL